MNLDILFFEWNPWVVLMYIHKKIWITDSNGRRYRLQIKVLPSLIRLDLFDGHQLAGYVIVSPQGDVLNLDDIIIDDGKSEEFRHSRDWEKLLGWLLKQSNYRGRGLGSKLLHAITEYAREQGYREIQGRIVAKDLQDTPHLLKWYRSHGFIVSIEDGYRDAVATIRMVLPSG